MLMPVDQESAWAALLFALLALAFAWRHFVPNLLAWGWRRGQAYGLMALGSVIILLCLAYYLYRLP